MRRPRFGFNGAAASLPRNARRVRRPARASARFNGAAASLPRNSLAADGRLRPAERLQWGRGIAAAESSWWTRRRSTRPKLQWGRGIAAAEWIATRSPRRRPGSFNGAAASLPRNVEPEIAKSINFCASMGPRHRCRGIQDEQQHPDRDPHASMGPRHRCRGIRSRGRRPATENWLQWGRGIAAAESPASRCLPRPETCFNGAAASLPRNRRGGDGESMSDFASMGPRHRCRGMS